MSDFLTIENVSKSFGPLRAVDRVSLSIAQGEVFSLLGPSGCGKTTLLRMLAGFETPDTGRLLLKGQDITHLPPERRPVNTVFQNYALFPHLTVWENIAFGLRMARKPKAEINAAVERMLGLIRLREHDRKRPAQLSGGQKQRVAIARALVNEPLVLLLDEPLAALDLKLRQHMISELTAIHEQVGTTFVYVTHDQGEAISLSHNIAVLHEGRVQQVDAPARLYEAPANAFVAGFIGDANLLPAVMRAETPGGQEKPGLCQVEIAHLGPMHVARPASPCPAGTPVKVMLRPEKILLSPGLPSSTGNGGGGDMNTVTGTVVETTYFGPSLRWKVQSAGLHLQVQQQLTGAVAQAPDLKPGQEVTLRFQPEAACVIPS